MEFVQKTAEIVDLVNRIEKWAVNLKLDVNSNPIKQVLKYQEEIGELAKAIQKNDILEILDGIGDCVVVGAVMATQLRNQQAKNKFSEQSLAQQFAFGAIIEKALVENSFYCSNKAIQNYITYCVDAFNQDEHGEYLYNHYGKVLTNLKNLSETLNLEFTNAVKMAYSTIHFRSGEIVDGIFVKKQPQATIIVPTLFLIKPIDNIINFILNYAKENEIQYFKISFDLNSDNLTHKEV